MGGEIRALPPMNQNRFMDGALNIGASFGRLRTAAFGFIGVAGGAVEAVFLVFSFFLLATFSVFFALFLPVSHNDPSWLV